MKNLLSKSEIYRISNNALKKIIPLLQEMIRNKSGSAVTLKNSTIGAFKRAMNTFKTTVKESRGNITIIGEIGLNKIFGKFDKIRGGQKINLFDLYDRSSGKEYIIRARNKKHLRFKFEKFQPKNSDITFIKIKNGFMRLETDGWYVYVTEARRKSFKGFKTFRKENKFSEYYFNDVVSERNAIVGQKITARLLNKVKGLRKI